MKRKPTIQELKQKPMRELTNGEMLRLYFYELDKTAAEIRKARGE